MVGCSLQYLSGPQCKQKNCKVTVAPIVINPSLIIQIFISTYHVPETSSLLGCTMNKSGQSPAHMRHIIQQRQT